MNVQAVSQFLHAPEWEAFLKETGQTVAREDEVVYVKGNLPRGGSYWRSSRLIIPEDWHPPTFTKGAWFIRIEPLNDIPASINKHGLLRPTNSVQPKQTLIVDLSQSKDEILKGMKSKHRYNIRVAERHGVEVELIHKQAAQHFDRFWELLNTTAERHTFRTHSRDYYKTMIEYLAPRGMVHLAFATLEGQDLAAALFVTYNKTCTYLHGGSTTTRKEVMAPYLLHWQMMCWAQTQGHTMYDFWGVNAVQENEKWEPRQNHPSAGTTRFKLGFGGELVQYPGPCDLVLRPFPYTLYSGIRRVLRRQSNF
jgi:peptidoglycan pentaglycine glycine transferase (the first glycine)